MNRTTKWFWVLVAAQALFLLAWAGYHEVVRRHAPVLLLKARPVDPQDLLRGDFMTVRYDISDVTLPAESEARADSTVWVLLEPRDRHYVAVQAARTKLQPKPGQVLVRGERDYSWSRGTATAHVRYGIEKYFVPEGKGTPTFKLMEVEVSISPAQRLNIKRVLLDGKAYP